MVRNPILEVMLLDHGEPTNYEEAMISLDSTKWLEAMKSEMGSMYENADSSVTIYKASLVENLSQQVELCR